MDRTQTLAIMAAILESGDRAAHHMRSTVFSAADYISRARMILKETEKAQEALLCPSADESATNITKIIEIPENRERELHVYAVKGTDVVTTSGEKLKRDPLGDYSFAGFELCKWTLPAVTGKAQGSAPKCECEPIVPVTAQLKRTAEQPLFDAEHEYEWEKFKPSQPVLHPGPCHGCGATGLLAQKHRNPFKRRIEFCLYDPQTKRRHRDFKTKEN